MPIFINIYKTIFYTKKPTGFAGKRQFSAAWRKETAVISAASASGFRYGVYPLTEQRRHSGWPAGNSRRLKPAAPAFLTSFRRSKSANPRTYQQMCVCIIGADLLPIACFHSLQLIKQTSGQTQLIRCNQRLSAYIKKKTKPVIYLNIQNFSTY